MPLEEPFRLATSGNLPQWQTFPQILTFIAPSEGEAVMDTIKSFAYLDEYKMYSLSSQIFQGLTESLTSYSSDTKEQGEFHNDVAESGPFIAQNLAAERATQERKYLHDYSYIKFESALQSSGRLMSVSSDAVPPLETTFASVNFVAVRGKVEFVDFKAIGSTLGKFNDLGEAVAYITEFGASVDGTAQPGVQGQRQRRGSNTGGRNQNLAKAKELAKQNNMYLDPDYLRKLSIVLEWGYREYFDISIKVGGHTFSATLQRQYFREPEDLIVKKYSRSSEREFVLVGTIAQGPGNAEPVGSPGTSQSEGTVQLSDAADLKEAVVFVSNQLNVLENMFAGKKENEIIIDPIALYREM